MLLTMLSKVNVTAARAPLGQAIMGDLSYQNFLLVLREI